MKTALIREIEDPWKVNRHLVVFTNYQGFILHHRKVRRSQIKGKVELFFDCYPNNFWLDVKNDKLKLEELNEKVVGWIAKIGQKPIQELEPFRYERFET